MRENEAACVQVVFGLQVEWQAAKGTRWTGFWTVPIPGGGEIQKEVKEFEQFLAGRPAAKAMRTASESIRRVAALVAGYIADMAAHAARPAPWDEPEREARPARQDDPHNRTI
jgi:hypothetical protein